MQTVVAYSNRKNPGKNVFHCEVSFLYHKSLIIRPLVRLETSLEQRFPTWCLSLVVHQPLLSGMVEDAAYYLHGGIYLNPGATPVPPYQQPQGNQLRRMVGDRHMARHDS